MRCPIWIAILLLCFGSAASAAPTVICNDDMGPLWLTYITKEGAGFRSHGWFRIEAGVCAEPTGAASGDPLWIYGQNGAGEEAFSGTHGFCITNEKMDNADVRYLGQGPMINYVPPGVGLKPCSDPRRVGVFAELAPKEDRMAVSARCAACGGAMPSRRHDAVSGAKRLGEGMMLPSERGK